MDVSRLPLRLIGIVALVFIAIAGFGAALLYLPLFQVLRMVLIIGGLLIGAGVVVLSAYLIGPLSPKIGGPLGAIMFKVAAKGRRWGQLIYDDSNEYHIESVDPAEVEDNTAWERLSRVPFVIGYERTDDAFREHAVETPDEAGNVVSGTGSKIALEPRGDGSEQFYDADVDNPDEKIWLSIPDKLQELQDAATGSAAKNSDRSATVDYGGDTSEYSPWVMLIGTMLFLAAGAALGMVMI